MTDQDDLDLRQRLERLAAATPVMPPQELGAVPVVRVRRRSLAFGSLAPVLSLVVAGIVLAGLTHVGPFATGSAGPDTGVSATSRSGDFELTVHASKMAYEVGAPIHVTAAFTYHGGAPVDISHAYKGPLGFGVVEPVNGLTLSPAWRQSCQTQTLAPGDRLTQDFVKSGGFDGADPSVDAYASFFADPGLSLPAGTWHIYAVAEFSIGDCGAPSSSMRAEITIHVAPAAAVATPDTGTADPSNGLLQPDGSVVAIADDGVFEVRLRSSKATYVTGEALDINATVAYIGDAANRGKTFEEDVSFSGIQMDGDNRFDELVHTLICGPKGLDQLPRDLPLGIGKGYGPDSDRIGARVSGGQTLPPGRWRLHAVFRGSIPACLGESHQLDLSIDITVLPEVATPEVPASPAAANDPVVDTDDVGDVQLTLGSAHSRYQEREPIDVSTAYVYVGGDSSMTVNHFAPEVGYSLVQADSPDAPVQRALVYDSACVERTLIRDVPVAGAIDQSNLLTIRAHTLPAFFSAYLDQGRLAPPVGRWRLTAFVTQRAGTCAEPGENIELQASVEFEVVP